MTNRKCIQYSWLLVALVLFSTTQVGCRKAPISEYPPFIDLPRDQRFSELPAILVGRIVDCTESGDPRISKWNGHSIQLYRLTITVENVLQGSVESNNLAIFYYLDLGAMVGPARLGMSGNGGSWRLGSGTWHIGDRELFFLQRESGVLRTVCDTWRHCVVPVLSGAHPHFQPDPDRSIGQQLTDILLDRGENCSDQQLATAVEKSSGAAWSFSNYYAVRKLIPIALTTKSATLRGEACSAIASLGGLATHPPDPATAALNAACAQAK